MKTAFIITIVLLMGVAAIAVLVNIESVLDIVDQQIRLLSPVESALLIVIWVTLGTVMLVPASVLFVVSGSIFGIWWSFAFNTLGFLIGANAAFLLGRYAFHGIVESRGSETLQRFNRHFSDAGWQSIAVVRLTPIFPSFIMNYLLGVSHVRWWDYLWPSFVFTLPSCFLLTYLGDSGRAAVEGSNNLLARAVVIVSLLLALAILARIINNRARPPDQHPSDYQAKP